MTVDLKHLTYDVYLAMPGMKQRYSILSGELVMGAAPHLPHQLRLTVDDVFPELDFTRS